MILIGTSEACGRTMVEHQSIDALRERARKLKLKHWAIYRDSVRGRKFHNATDEDYLVEHFNSPYWLNRGVESANKGG